ncbi:hypothetical protein AURDEDRAFT_171538 [Auricularia subglabra TFB-10046 SS5]|nr:hypothetical protein AURDEDRAFT_171538 [Auricularia subglabra TFB-10046 SS5]
MSDTLRHSPRDDGAHRATPPPDAAFLSSVPVEFSMSRTEQELLATGPAALRAPPRYSYNDRSTKRVIYRIVRYVELLRTNDTLLKRFMGEVLEALGQDGAIGQPPAFPFNDAAWHGWLLQPAPSTLGAEEFFDLGPMPLPAPWDGRAPFTNSLDFIEHVDATWEIAADMWRENAERALALAEQRTAAAHARRAPPAREWLLSSPESRSLAWDSVLGHLESPDVYLRDPLAPTRRRHCFYLSYALLPVELPSARPRSPSSNRPRRAPPRELIYVRSNVDYIPQLPPDTLAICRTDGRYGPHEISRWAQWHEVGHWHHGFIPINRRDGRAHLNDHSSLTPRDDMAWYTPNWQSHFTRCGARYFLMKKELWEAFSFAWYQTERVFQNSRNKYPSLVGQPYSAFETGRRALNLLRAHQLDERGFMDVIATFQRSLLEVRGWNEFVRCRMWLKGFQERNGNPEILPGADTRRPGTRRWTRGIWTHIPEVANLYGQYGVPVFLVQIVRHDFQPPLTDFVPEGPIRITKLVGYRYAYETWSDKRLPLHVAAVQEPGYVVHAVQSELQGEAHVDEDANMHDNALPVVHDDALPIVHDDPAPVRRDDAPPMRDVVMRDEGAGTEISRKRSHEGHGGGSSSGGVADTHPTKRRKKQGASTGPQSEKPGPQKKDGMKFKFPYRRHRTGAPLPDWWPESWAVAVTAVEATEGRDDERLKALSQSPDFPVDVTANPGRLGFVPVMEHFVGRKDELKCSLMLVAWSQMRGHRMRQFATMAIREVPRWNAEDWRSITTNKAHPRVQAAWARQLGFPLDPPPARVAIAEPEYRTPLADGADSAPSPTASSALSLPSVPPSTAPSTVPSTAPSTRAPSMEFDTDYDSDMEVDMTQVDSAGRRIHPENSCFVEVVDGRTADGCLLAREDERYLKELPGWRRKAPGQLRGYADFRLFAEDSHDDDGVLCFQRIGANSRKQYSDWGEFWDYDGGRILFVLNTVGQRAGGGEHLTKPIRLMPFAVGKPKVPDPVQLRVWPAPSFDAKLYVPQDALGAVGSRTRCAAFRVSDEDYDKLFPGAPPQRALTSDASSSLAAAAVSKPAVSSLVQPSAAPPSTASPSIAQPSAAATSTSSSSPSSSMPARAELLSGPPPAVAPKPVIKSKADHWAAQGAVEVPKEGAPTPLYDLLVPRGEIFFNEHVLPEFADQPAKDYAWPSKPWRKMIIWDLCELTFRTALFALDDHLRRTYPDAKGLNEETVLERQRMLCEIWGDTTFVPNGPSPLTNADWRARVSALRSFHRVASTWPRTGLPAPPAEFADESEFVVFERSVWYAYTQTYSDYFLREPPVPLRYPDIIPWAE